MAAGRQLFPLRTMGQNIVALPVMFTTDAAGAVVDTTSPGNGATVIKVPATTGQYRILLGRDDTRPDRYKSLLHCEPGISSSDFYAVRLLDEDVEGTTPYVDLQVGVPSPSFVVSLGAPVAASANGAHAAVAGNAAADLFPGPYTDPAQARCLSVTFAAGWDGGDVTLVGTDQFGDAATEVVGSVPGSTIDTAICFATITSATKAAVGAAADAASVGWGDKIALLAPLSDPNGVLLCDDVVEVAPVFDDVNHGVATITATNGARVFKAIANFAADPVAANAVSATIGVTLWLEG
jgi:hypothetical protein